MALPSLPTGKKKLQIHPMGLIIILLSFGAWVVALGGVGASQQTCSSKGVTAGSTVTLANVACGKQYQWQWWGVWFEICLLIALFVTAFFEAFHKGKLVFISYFLLATMVLMWGAKDFIDHTHIGDVDFSATDSQQVANNAGAAGFVMLCIFNFALLIILGFEDLPSTAPKPLEPEMTNNV